MSAQKITEHEARDIAYKIAARAFEHLVDPVEKELNGYGCQAYAALVEGIGGEDTVRKLVAFKLGEYSKSIKIEVIDGQGNETYVNYRVETDSLLSTHRWTSPELVNGTLHMHIVDAQTRLNALTHKRNLLGATLQTQMQGKSAKSVLKAWPEAAEFVEERFGVSSDSTTLVAPLEALLARFLPALPNYSQEV